MQIIPVIFLFCFAAFTNAQNLEITYVVSKNEAYFEHKKEEAEKKFGTSVAFLKTMKETMSNFKYIGYTLIIDGAKGAFYMNESMNVDSNSSLKIARIMAGFGSGIYFSDSKNELKLRKVNAYGQTFLISSSYNELDWTLTSETKQLNGFKTYKAYTTEFTESSSGTHQLKITAWFAPEISKPFGPGGYGNLPGLILELRRAGKIYQVKKIEKTQKTVEKPTEGKKISKEKFVEIGRKINTRR